MSIFSLYDDEPLTGDKKHRQIESDVLEYEHFRQDAGGEEIFKKIPKTLWIPYSICMIVLAILLGQLLNLQISQGAFNKTLAEGNRVRTREITPPRGLIYDSKGQILARNKASYNLEVYPLDLPRNKTERQAILEKLSKISQIPLSEIQLSIDEKGILSYEPVVLKENLDRDTALILQVRTANLPGVVMAKKPIREYENFYGLSQVIGFVGKMSEKDLTNYPTYKPFYEIGKDGLEASYEKFIHGKPGIVEIEVDSRGRQQRELKETLPEPGNNLILSINGDLEDYMAKRLASEIDAANAPGGAAIAMDPRTGQILGLVNQPTYDNNIFSSNSLKAEYQKIIDDPNKPMYNRAVSGNYPSGSIIKPVVASAGLEEGVITENTTISDPGEIKVGSWTYPDWKTHGYTDVRKAIAESCNVFFYAVAGGWDKIEGLGVNKLTDYLVKFGFSEKTGIDLPSENKGNVPSPEWKKEVKKEMWYLGDTYHLGIGQGDFLITPLEMVNAISAIANGGELLKPRIVQKITDQENHTIYENQKEVIRKNFIKDENLQIVREGMRLAVTGGSARLLGDLRVDAAAKTGTAQFGTEGKTHSWMVSYAPYHNPEIAIVVLIEEGGEGYATAGPVTRDMLDWYFNNK